MIQNIVAEGIHLVRHANVKCYIDQQDERFMIVDAGLPAVWGDALVTLDPYTARAGPRSWRPQQPRTPAHKPSFPATATLAAATLPAPWPTTAASR